MLKGNFLASWLCLSLAFAPAVLGGEEESSAPDAAAASQAAGSSASRVYIDPDTGRVGGPPEGVNPPGLSIAEQKMLSRSGRGLQVRQLPDGTRLLNLEGRFQNMGTATVSESGHVHLNCSHSESEVAQSLKAAGRGGDEQ